MTHPFVRWWWVILLAAVAAAGAAFVTVSQQPPQHEAQVRLLVGALDTDFDMIRAAESLATTYAELATSGVLLEQAADDIGLEDVRALDDDVSAVTIGTSRIVLVTATRPDPAEATALANAVASAMQAFDGPRGGDLRVLDAATDADEVPSRLLLLVAISALGGAGLVAALLLLLEARRGPASHPWGAP